MNVFARRSLASELGVDVRVGVDNTASTAGAGGCSADAAVSSNLTPHFGRIEDSFAALRPSGAISSQRVTNEQERYFALRETADAIGEDLEGLFERYSSDRLARLESRQPDALGRRSRYRVTKANAAAGWKETYDQPAGSLFAAQSMEEALRDLASASEPEAGDANIIDLERRLALLAS